MHQRHPVAEAEVELSPKSSGKTKRASRGGADNGACDPELTAVFDVWPRLASHSRSAIVGITCGRTLIPYPPVADLILPPVDCVTTCDRSSIGVATADAVASKYVGNCNKWRILNSLRWQVAEKESGSKSIVLYGAAFAIHAPSRLATAPQLLDGT